MKEGNYTGKKKVYTAKKEIHAEDKRNESTSWGKVAKWYRDTVEDTESYQAQVIEPNLLRVLGNIQGKKVLDIACGEGFFASKLAEKGAIVHGIDIGEELIALAQKKYTKPTFQKLSATDIDRLKSNEYDIAICILALQNIDDVKSVFRGVSQVLKRGGRFVFVLNHPAFRNPKVTDWAYDEEMNAQYRKVYEYLSEAKVQIDMTPGEKNKYKKKFTISYRRPLQFFTKQLSKHDLYIHNLEEWVSHKNSEPGPKSVAENKARHEIPLFMCIDCVLYTA